MADTPPRLDAEHRRLLGLLGLAIFFEGYGRSIVSVMLWPIGRDLGVPDTELSFALAFISAGALGVLVLGHLIDRFGRRRLLLASVLLYSLLGAATATPGTQLALVAWQAAARMLQEGVLADEPARVVPCADERPHHLRGRGRPARLLVRRAPHRSDRTAAGGGRLLRGPRPGRGRLLSGRARRALAELHRHGLLSGRQDHRAPLVGAGALSDESPRHGVVAAHGGRRARRDGGALRGRRARCWARRHGARDHPGRDRRPRRRRPRLRVPAGDGRPGARGGVARGPVAALPAERAEQSR